MADAAEKEDDQEEQGRRHQLWPVTVTTIGFQRSAGGSVIIPEFGSDWEDTQALR